MAAAAVTVIRHKKEDEAAARRLSVEAAADGSLGPNAGAMRASSVGPQIKEFLPMQFKVRRWYINNYSQLFVAALILGNFFVTCLEKEIDPLPGASKKYEDLWDGLDMAFNILFLIELLINIYGNGGPFKRFWSSPWNVFDFFVVLVGVLFMTPLIDPNSPLSNLKMLRAFRVFRLFKRIKSLNKIIVALVRSLPGVFHAFVIMLIFMMIYAILAVEYFSTVGTEHSEAYLAGEAPLGTYVTYGDDGVNHTISAETARGFMYGWEYYGTFFRAMYTLFQVMTGESWSEAVARPLMFGLYRNAVTVSLFYVSFLLLMQIVLTNVVVAVLLDKFVANDSDDAGEQEEPGGGEEDVAAPSASAAKVHAVDAGTWEPKAIDEPIAAPTAAAAPLEQKLDLILRELASLRKEVGELRQKQSL